MEHVNAKLNICPETVGKLSMGKGVLWSAAHSDGSDNRINGQAIADTATVSFSAAAMVGGFQWIRKLFRNREKTGEDFAAEKEAVKINRASEALKQQLLDYLSSAQEGSIDPEALDDLAKALEEIHGYHQSGKLIITGENELAEILKSITEFTDSFAESKSIAPVQKAGGSAADEFSQIRELILRQKELLHVGG